MVASSMTPPEDYDGLHSISLKQLNYKVKVSLQLETPGQQIVAIAEDIAQARVEEKDSSVKHRARQWMMR
jgi:hypothetical protein